MLATLPIYDTKPWEAAYGTAIDKNLLAPRYRNLVHLVHSACECYAQKTAFTAVVPNGMNGSLSSVHP